MRTEMLVQCIREPLRWKDSTRCVTAREPHEMRILQQQQHRWSFQKKRRTNFIPSHTSRSHWAESRWLALGSVCSVFRRPLQDASEQPTPGRDRIRLRSQQAKPLPVDLNPYLRRWADLITCACATFYQAATPACGFVSHLQVPGPSTL